EGEFLGEPFTVQLCQEMAQTGVNLVTSVGQQDKQGGGSTAPCQVMEKVQAGLVTPMQVLHDQQRRLFGGQSGEPSCQCLEEATFLLFWLKRGEWGRKSRIGQRRHQVRDELSKLASERFQLSGDLSSGLT